GCREVAEMCERLKPTEPTAVYSTACYRAITATILRAKDKSPEGAKQADEDLDQAMMWLKRAVAAGYRDASNMKRDKDLDALRSRADFRKLMADLEAGKDGSSK